MNKNFIIFFIFIFQLFHLNADIRDLNALKQDFVLETKKINIHGHPNAFNPSIVKWKNQYLMSFRTYDPLLGTKDQMGVIWLNDDFEPVGKPSIITRVREPTTDPSEAKDARLIVVDNEIYVVYSNLYPFESPASRMFIGKLDIQRDGSFIMNDPTPIIYYDKEIRSRKEKNWVPFVYNQSLMLSYSIQPHRVLLPQLETESALTLDKTIGTMKWDWGVLRGGTPALLVEGQYIAFFHSDKAMATVQSDGVVMNHYFMGAYTFEAEPPFAVTGISPHPIVARTFYEGPMYKTWKPLRVVFPGGYVLDDKYIWVAYGRQDHEVWLVKLDKLKLLSNLKPVKTIKPKWNN